MRKILLFITLCFSLLAGAQETAAPKTDASSGRHSAKVFLRCGRKPEPNSVLLIVDGLIYKQEKLKEINPDEILEIKVLKKAEAVALAGAWAEGVILLRTNRKPGQIVVRDREDRKPLASASLVFEQGARHTHLIADENGRVNTERITPERTEVKISCVGYKTQTVWLDINNKSFHEVVLERACDTLQEVVVTNYTHTRCGRCRISCGGVCIKTEAYDTLPQPAALLQLYPNPAKSASAVYLQTPSTKSNLLRAELLNASGQLVKTINIPSSKISTARFDLPLLSAGMYYVRLTDALLGKSYVGSLVVQ